jgi:hypothetical protein
MWCAVAHARYVTPGRSADRCVPCTQIILEVRTPHRPMWLGSRHLTRTRALPSQEAAYCDPGLVRSACCTIQHRAPHPHRRSAQVSEVVVPLLRCAAFS